MMIKYVNDELYNYIQNYMTKKMFLKEKQNELKMYHSRYLVNRSISNTPVRVV